MAEKIKIFQGVINTYEELIDLLDDTDTDNAKKLIFQGVITTYRELIELEDEESSPPKAPAKAPSPAPAPAPAPSSATQSVVKTDDEKKLEKIKKLLQANETMLKECGFKIEP